MPRPEVLNIKAVELDPITERNELSNRLRESDVVITSFDDERPPEIERKKSKSVLFSPKDIQKLQAESDSEEERDKVSLQLCTVKQYDIHKSRQEQMHKSQNSTHDSCK